MGKIKLVYESDSGLEEILGEEIVDSEVHNLEKLESQVESFRKRSLPLATAKLLEEGQASYIKKSDKD